jgi:hypothetical protein
VPCRPRQYLGKPKFSNMVPEVGLEPTWGCPRQILSLVRIPISPLRHEPRMIRRGIGQVKKPLFHAVHQFEIGATSGTAGNPRVRKGDMRNVPVSLAYGWSSASEAGDRSVKIQTYRLRAIPRVHPLAGRLTPPAAARRSRHGASCRRGMLRCWRALSIR